VWILIFLSLSPSLFTTLCLLQLIFSLSLFHLVFSLCFAIFFSLSSNHHPSVYSINDDQIPILSFLFRAILDEGKSVISTTNRVKRTSIVNLYTRTNRRTSSSIMVNSNKDSVDEQQSVLHLDSFWRSPLLIEPVWMISWLTRNSAACLHGLCRKEEN